MNAGVASWLIYWDYDWLWCTYTAVRGVCIPLDANNRRPGRGKKYIFTTARSVREKAPSTDAVGKKKVFPHNFCTEGDVIKLIRWMVVDEYDRKVHQKWNCDILMTSTAANYAVELN